MTGDAVELGSETESTSDRRKLKVVFLSPTAPAHSGNGLAMRAALLARSFASDELITAVFPVVSNSVYVELRGRREEMPDVESVQRTMVRLMGSPQWRQRLTLLNDLPQLAYRAPLGFAAPIAAGLVSIDVVVCLRSYLLPLAALLCDELERRSPTASRPTLVVDLDDDDATTFRQIGNPDAARFDPMIAAFSPWVTQFFSANESEADVLSARIGRPVWALANGIELPARVSPWNADGSLLMVGNFGYGPNIEGARWLLDEVVAEFGPTTRRRRLRFVGSGSESLAVGATDVTVDRVGFVPDLSEEYADAAVAVVPLQSGGGTRIKVLEAAAQGVPIVSTTVGAAGHGWNDSVELRIGDTPQAFANAIEETLVEHEKTRRQIQRSAARVAEHDVGLLANWFRSAVERLHAAPGNVVK